MTLSISWIGQQVSAGIAGAAAATAINYFGARHLHSINPALTAIVAIIINLVGDLFANLAPELPIGFAIKMLAGVSLLAALFVSIKEN